jgi:hypothetical protein
VNASAESDLSGQWTGMFNYPGLLPPVAFEAELRDLAGSISGTISEPDESPNGSAATLRSIVDGAHEGSTVSFTKIYEDEDRMPEPVFYSGSVQAGGNEISGRWEIAGEWSGTFLMVRATGSTEAAEAEAAVELPLEEP